MALAFGNSRQQLTFEDLKGLRAEGYVRDSTLDQQDGYGTAVQRKAIETFANAYDLVLKDEWYTDFITGTSTLRRSGFKQALSDAAVDRFDVLLVYHTSRFARNRSDAIRYKEQLRGLGKIVVFVSQGIISGNDSDFLNEGINEVLDEQYSRNLSRWIGDGLRMKHQDGIANGKPPLGYRSDKLENGKRERKVPNPEGLGGDPKKGGMQALLALLSGYASGRFSYRSLADHLNTEGYRNREGKPFTDGSVEHVLSNRFYEGKAVFHPGLADEEVLEGAHEVPDEIRRLWIQSQEVKRHRSRPAQSLQRPGTRIYPFTGVLRCDECGKPYHGEAVIHKDGRTYQRMYHHRSRCRVNPRSVNSNRLSKRFGSEVLEQVDIDDGWKDTIAKVLVSEAPRPDNTISLRRLDAAIENLRKQHIWGAIGDDEFEREFRDLERSRRALEEDGSAKAINMPNLERAARLLGDLPKLWEHPGVSGDQRKELVRRAFDDIRIDGHQLVSVTPKPEYAPLFAYTIWRQNKVMGGVGVTGLEPAASWSRTTRATNCATPRRLFIVARSQVF